MDGIGGRGDAAVGLDAGEVAAAWEACYWVVFGLRGSFLGRLGCTTVELMDGGGTAVSNAINVGAVGERWRLCGVLLVRKELN